MTIAPGWHPVIVHFPLALIVTAAMCLSMAWVIPARRCAESLAIVGTWNLCLGALAAFFALASGLAAIIDLRVGAAAHAAVVAHVKSALLATFLVTSVAVWRGAGVPQNSRPSWIFMLLLWTATSVLVVTGYRGGQNVFRYGVGVSVDGGERSGP